MSDTLLKNLRDIIQKCRDLDRDYRDFRPEVDCLDDEQVYPVGPHTSKSSVVDGHVEAYWRFVKLTEQAEPLVMECDGQLRTGDGSNVSGRVLFWAMGNQFSGNYSCERPIIGAFAILGDRLQELADAIAQGAHKTEAQSSNQEATPDPTAYVNASTLWRDKLKSYGECKKFLADHPEIRNYSVGRQRMIHSGDWARVWAKIDRAGFEKLDDSADRPVVPDTVSTPLYLENAIKLFGAIGQGKKNVVNRKK